MRRIPTTLARDLLEGGEVSQDRFRAFCKRGGWLNSEIRPHGGMQIVGHKREMLLDLTRKVRQQCTRCGTVVRVGMGVKVHVVKPDPGAGWSEETGFNYNWIHYIPQEEWLAGWAPFVAAGYRPALAPTMPADVNTKAWENAPDGYAPLQYWIHDLDRKELRAASFVMDLRNGRYRKWLLAEWQRFQAQVGADYCELGAKNFAFRYPAGPVLIPEQETSWQGTITPTPYGPGEWEAAWNDLLRRFRGAGIPVVLNQLPTVDWDWLTPEERDGLLGEYQGTG